MTDDAPSPLDLAGKFHIKSALSQDGIGPAVMPPTCDNHVLLIRSANATTARPATGSPRAS